jgi:HSP20 family molecular chaperone IbpA
LIISLIFPFRWLQDPPRLQRELCPVTGHKKRAHSDKFRVTLDVTGYKPEDLSVKVVGRKLYIDGKQEFRDGNIQMIEKETFI